MDFGVVTGLISLGKVTKMLEIVKQIGETIQQNVRGVQVAYSKIPTSVADLKALVSIRLGKITPIDETSAGVPCKFRYDFRVEVWTRQDNILLWYDIADQVVNALHLQTFLEGFTSLMLNDLTFLEYRGEYVYGYMDFVCFKIGEKI